MVFAGTNFACPFVLGFERCFDSAQSFFQRGPRAPIIDSYKVFTAFAKGWTVTECNFGILYKKLLRIAVDARFGTIDPAQIGCLWAGYLQAGQLAVDIVDHEVSIFR
mgnify:CR=1 FL=1